MRVIAGRFRRRILKSVPGMDVRPTPDRMRETLFSILQLKIEGAAFVDAYAGSGAVGIEALSRGARRVTFIETNRSALSVIRENLQTLGVTAEAEVVAVKAALALARHEGDIVFLDPPYAMQREYLACLQLLGENPPLLVIAQHDSRLALSDIYGRLQRSRIVKQGDNSLSFFEPIVT